MPDPSSRDADEKSNANACAVPKIQKWFQDGFHRFLKPFLRRHFHAVGIDRHTLDQSGLRDDEPLLVYGNHPSWWDPLVAHFLNRNLFPTRQFYAPIDASALQQYQVFAKLGFYGVEMNSVSGTSDFLKQSRAILESPGTAIWMTPEGRFADVRDHHAPLMPGLAHLCSRRNSGWVFPLALEYVFWDDRLPVCLARLGVPINIADFPNLEKSQWNTMLSDRLRTAQTDLAADAIARCSDPFDNLLIGRAGAGASYDWFRWVRSKMTGKEFRPQHGDQFQ
ncbi:hypothetical protein K227x_30260 [Rubripirellula lacrimiformis]|uniref:Phospholipid/glycerol acyltransferase domain-containing protein n=1 Tax=Rubripirellula lacrimiformis TaxID=1930273 RepID=A0A517NBX1_9BACT|nr:lysophospholipid acyltransferase family protein [Rubripirellula lacrimiformis]QDT04633.1 hypothetical protein K227x_30260 [Rubripirellula lacrimiformis]